MSFESQSHSQQLDDPGHVLCLLVLWAGTLSLPKSERVFTGAELWSQLCQATSLSTTVSTAQHCACWGGRWDDVLT